MRFGNPLIPTEVSRLRKLNARATPATINLGLGQPAIDMPPELRELASFSILGHKLGYTPNAGRLDLREKIASFYSLDVEGLLVSHGAQEGLMSVLIALLAKGDEVLIPDPGFLAYDTMVKMAGGKTKPYSLKEKGTKMFSYNVDKILKAVTKKTKAVLICSPNNPTGTVIAQTERARLLKALARKKIFLISDDVYTELELGENYRPVSAESPYGVTVSSWSKSLALTGWRIGFVHTNHPALRAKNLAAHQYLTTCASAPAQALLFETLSRPELYRKILDSFRTEYNAKLALLHEALPEKARPELPKGGFYLFLPLPLASDEKTSDQLLNKENLLVVPGSYFGKEGRGCVRISVAAGEDKLKRAGEILSALWA